MERGKEIGIEQGKEIGIEQGREIGIEQGREIGIEQGIRALVEKQPTDRIVILPATFTKSKFIASGLPSFKIVSY